MQENNISPLVASNYRVDTRLKRVKDYTVMVRPFDGSYGVTR
jgi:hypothetical protein